MKAFTAFLLFSILSIYSFGQNAQTYAHLVNPFIGTGGHGHTYPGSTSPFGMVQLSPDTRNDDSWDGCSGYHYSDSVIYGFSHTHLSGTGCSDYGDVLLMPFTSTHITNATKQAQSKMNHSLEKAHAGYYSIALSSGVDVQLTTTPRTGIHEYNYPTAQNKWVLIDLKHRDELLKFSIEIVNDSTIIGYRNSKAWAKDQDLYFAIRSSQKITKILSAHGNEIDFEGSYRDKEENPILALQFDPTGNPTLLLRVGISQVSEDGALLNLQSEAPHNNFEIYKKDNENRWNAQLKKIEFTPDKIGRDTTFYSALYHCMIAPNIASDVDGKYRGMDRKVHHADFTYYSVFSLWDTYRALHPLFTIIERERSVDFIKTILTMYKQGGKLPVWELAGNETNCMIGYHSVSVMADALAKKIPFDIELACKAAEESANQRHFGIQIYASQGYLQMEDEPESVSKTIEYSYDDYCIAKLYLAAGNKEKADEYLKRSKNLFQLMDPQTGLMRPRTNGGFMQNFNPYQVDNNYTEANAWQYSFSYIHQLELAKTLLPQNLEKQLDLIFNANTKLAGRQQADMTGLIGQYVQGNEPSHHIAYMYMFTSEKWKTAHYLNEIMNTMFDNSPEGLPGNEDCGQMSAWYVFTALGFYPVLPGEDYYVYGKPFFKKAIIHHEEGSKTTLTCLNPELPFVSTINSNFNHQLIGFNHHLFNTNYTIEFIGSHTKPHAYIHNEKAIITGGIPSQPLMDWIPVPSIETSTDVFKDSLEVKISGVKNVQIFYKTNQTASFMPYTQPFMLHKESEIFAYAMYDGYKSDEVRKVVKTYKNKDLKVTFLTQPLASYLPSNGSDALIDGVLGDTEWRKGNWVGFQGQDVEIILEGNERKNTAFYVRLLQEERSWIFLPKAVDFQFYLNDKIVDERHIEIEKSKSEAAVIEALSKIKKKFNKVKISLRYPGPIPAPHPGAGHKSIQFIDEIGFK